MAADVFLFMVVTQILYLVWNAKLFFLGCSGRERLFVDAANPLPDESMDLPKYRSAVDQDEWFSSRYVS
jgi:hypothetical protein